MCIQQYLQITAHVLVEGNITAFWLKLIYNVEDGGCVLPLQENSFATRTAFRSFSSLNRCAFLATVTISSLVGWQLSFILQLYYTIDVGYVCALVI